MDNEKMTCFRKDNIPYTDFSVVVVKDRVGRRRYVLARVPKGTTTDSLITMAKRHEREGVTFWIIDHHDDFVLVRCKHFIVQDVRDTLNGEGLETVVTSGTIKGAETRASEKGITFRVKRKRKGRKPRRTLL
jgi:hypothetical protein